MKSSISYLGWGVSLLLPAVLMLSSCGENKTENTASAPAGVAASPTTPATTASPKPSTMAAPAANTTATKAAQVGTVAEGTNCPANAPVKGKANDRGKIYHVPKSNNYEKVKPTACFADVAAAEKAGYRAPKKQ